MHRFFIPPASLDGSAVYFPMEICRQMTTVLHLREGEHVVALDNTGREYEVELEIVAPRTTQGRVLAARASAGEPRTRLTLYVGLTQREKFEWVLQKCTEIGVAGFVPVVSSRSLVQSAEESLAKMERWQRILQEAAEQSGRGRIPTLAAPQRWEDALRKFKTAGQPGLIAWEEEKALGITPALAALGLSRASAGAPALSIFIGPEGGYSKDEIRQANAAGLASFTLGRRILRMETAAVAAAVLALHDLEE
jgi:16S rRNA (uracil1498-N3)-methyltransferase